MARRYRKVGAMRWRANERRATQPLITTTEYELAIAACVAAHEARQSPKLGQLVTSSWTVASWRVTPRLAAVIAVLVAIVGTVLASRGIHDKARSLVEGYIVRIEEAGTP